MKRITIFSILTIILMSSCIKFKNDSIIKVIDNVEREYFTVDGLRYELCLDNNSDGVSVVMLEEGKYQGEIIIPDEVKYKGDMLKVMVIGADAFKDCDQLKKVEIEAVQVVGSDAFRGCDNLEDVLISNTQIVGENSFDECNKNMKVSLNNVMVIKKDAFNGCRNIETK
ncbi:MAG: hypothetical protein E7079_05485 [Bacteroidales bacterium]|nr:hypothetical protein [Bacteroidales bacterium]